MPMQITLLMIVLLSAITSAGNVWDPASELTKFSKKMQDGSTLTLENKKYAETITRFESMDDNVGIRLPESKGTIFRCRLIKIIREKREVVWERMVIIYAASGLRPQFIVKDANLFQNKLYILYAFGDGYLNLTVLEREAPGRWSNVTCLRLDDRPRSLHECQLVQDSKGLGITCIDPNTPTLHAEKWNIVDGRFQKLSAK